MAYNASFDMAEEGPNTSKGGTNNEAKSETRTGHVAYVGGGSLEKKSFVGELTTK